jgi:hypothetical protein
MPAIAIKATAPTTTPATHALLALFSLFSEAAIMVGKDGIDVVVSVGRVDVEDDGRVGIDVEDDVEVVAASTAPGFCR